MLGPPNGEHRIVPPAGQRGGIGVAGAAGIVEHVDRGRPGVPDESADRGTAWSASAPWFVTPALGPVPLLLGRIEPLGLSAEVPDLLLRADPLGWFRPSPVALCRASGPRAPRAVLQRWREQEEWLGVKGTMDLLHAASTPSLSHRYRQDQRNREREIYSDRLLRAAYCRAEKRGESHQRR